MLATALASALHVFGIAIGLGSIYLRARGLFDVAAGDRAALARVFRADNAWGIAALLLIGSGVARAFGGLEKGTYFYTHNYAFHVKLTLFAALLLLELWPMVTFVRWRVALSRGRAIDDDTLTARAALFARLSVIETALVAAVIVVAPFMARGAWMAG